MRHVQRLLDWHEHADECLAQGRQQRRRVGKFALVHALAQAFHQFGAGFDADIGGDQGGFEFVEQVVIELWITYEQRAQAARENVAGKAFAPAAFGGGNLFGGLLLPELEHCGRDSKTMGGMLTLQRVLAAEGRRASAASA